MAHPIPTPEPAGEHGRDDALTAPIADLISVAFPTPIVMHDWPDSQALNAALADLIRAEAAGGAALTKSNVGGWHSGMAFLNRQDAPAIARLRHRIRALVSALIPQVMRPPEDGRSLHIAIEGWANILTAGDYNTLHNHPNASWSGVYYVTGNPRPADGEPARPFEGKLEFVDPRPGASLTYADTSTLYGRCMVEPRAGRMVLFPSWLQHFVHPCPAGGQRLSIAFNITLRED